MSAKTFLETVGKDFVKGLEAILPYAAGPGEVAVSLFAPALGPLFNSTVAIVVAVEQKYAALGKQSGTGAQKLADVLQIAQPVIAQGLNIAGKSNETALATNYVNSVVAVLNAAPAPAPAAAS
ncbi:MAG: hypothetical protein ABSG08_22845 [Terriglobales bacterium]|jgi:hypothetical protein